MVLVGLIRDVELCECDVDGRQPVFQSVDADGKHPYLFLNDVKQPIFTSLGEPNAIRCCDPTSNKCGDFSAFWQCWWASRQLPRYVSRAIFISQLYVA